MRPRSLLQERVCEVSQPSDGFPSPISLSTFLWYSKRCSVSSYLWSRGCMNINDYSNVLDLRLLFFHTQAGLDGWHFLPSRPLPFTRRRNDYFDSRPQQVPKLWQRPCNASECGQKGLWRWSTWASSNGAASRHGPGSGVQRSDGSNSLLLFWGCWWGISGLRSPSLCHRPVRGTGQKRNGLLNGTEIYVFNLVSQKQKSNKQKKEKTSLNTERLF